MYIHMTNSFLGKLFPSLIKWGDSKNLPDEIWLLKTDVTELPEVSDANVWVAGKWVYVADATLGKNLVITFPETCQNGDVVLINVDGIHDQLQFTCWDTTYSVRNCSQNKLTSVFKFTFTDDMQNAWNQIQITYPKNNRYALKIRRQNDLSEELLPSDEIETLYKNIIKNSDSPNYQRLGYWTWKWLVTDFYDDPDFPEVIHFINESNNVTLNYTWNWTLQKVILWEKEKIVNEYSNEDFLNNDFLNNEMLINNNGTILINLPNGDILPVLLQIPWNQQTIIKRIELRNLMNGKCSCWSGKKYKHCHWKTNTVIEN